MGRRRSKPLSSKVVLHCLLPTVLIHDCHRGIDDWKVTLFEKCETHKQLKESETFWQHILRIFYPLGVNEKEEYLF